jgi:hypothetical protein
VFGSLPRAIATFFKLHKYFIMKLGILFFGFRVNISPPSEDKEKDMRVSAFDESKHSFGKDNR